MFKIKTRVKIVRNCPKGCTRSYNSDCGIGARAG